MIKLMEAAAAKVREAIHEHRERGEGLKQLCRSLKIDPEDLTALVDTEAERLNGSGTVDGALLHGILIGALAGRPEDVEDGIDWAMVGKLVPPHELRTRILLYLLEHVEASPNAMAKALDETLGNVSYHVAVLAGKNKPGARLGANGPEGGRKSQAIHETPLLELSRTEPRRGAVEHFYRLTPLAKGETDAA